MLCRLCVSFAALVFTFPVWADETREISKSRRVIAIYTENWSLGSEGTPELIFAAWGDGQIVWSHDRKNGGAPFLSGTVSPDVITQTLKNFEKVGLFKSASLQKAQFGPDSRFTTILVRDGEDELIMRSWHEQFGFGPHLAATSRGVEVLNDRILLEVLADEPAHYLLYRMMWSEIRLVAVDLTPASGAALTGSLRMRRGDLSWVTTGVAEP